VTIALPRVAHLGVKGPDVVAYKRTLVRLDFREQAENDANKRHHTLNGYGLRLGQEVAHFQHRRGIHVTGNVNRDTFELLARHFDSYDRWLIGQEVKRLQPEPWELVTGAWVAMLRHAPFPYEQVRPYPRELDLFYRLGSDCSGTFEGAYHYAHLEYPHLQDPSGLGFDGYGYTGTLLSHGRRVSTPEPGDAAFYYSDRHHVGGVLDHSGRVFSHGKPGDPHVISAAYAVEIRRYL
jgi:hypothetical protein